MVEVDPPHDTSPDAAVRRASWPRGAGRIAALRGELGEAVRTGLGDLGVVGVVAAAHANCADGDAVIDQRDAAGDEERLRVGAHRPPQHLVLLQALLQEVLRRAAESSGGGRLHQPAAPCLRAGALGLAGGDDLALLVGDDDAGADPELVGLGKGGAQCLGRRGVRHVALHLHDVVHEQREY